MSALGPIVAFNGSFLTLWVQRGGSDVVVLVAAINAFLLSLLTLWGWCITGTGHAPRLVRMSLISAAINLVASVSFTYTLGVVGPLLGTTTAFICVNIWYLPKLLREYFGTSLRELILAAVTPVALGAPMTLVLWYVVRWLLPKPGWIVLMLEMSVSAMAYLIIATGFLLGPADRALWRRRIIGALPQFRGQSLDPIDPVGPVGPVDPIDPK
jgi:O-antigen/teichoic acid export membrane protein